MSYQDKGFLASSSYFYGQEVLDVLQISQLMSSNVMSVAKLGSNLTQIIEQCKSHYGGKPELATDADSKVVFLCFLFEQILSHGLRSKVNFSSNSNNIQQLMQHLREFNITAKSKLEFWNCVSFIIPAQERERILSLQSICSDIGRCRAWLRSSLNERSLERYLKCLLCEAEVLEQFYEPKAWVRDRDKQKLLLKAAADLSPIVFALPIDLPELNQISPETDHLLHKLAMEPVIIPSEDAVINPTMHSIPLSSSPRLNSPTAGSPSGSPSRLRRVKKPSQSIITFDQGETTVVRNPEKKYNPETVGHFDSNELGKMSLDELVRLGIIPEISMPIALNTSNVDTRNVNIKSETSVSGIKNSNVTREANFTLNLNEQKEPSSNSHVHSATYNSLPQEASTHKSSPNTQLPQQNLSQGKCDSSIGTSHSDALKTVEGNSEKGQFSKVPADISYDRQSSVDSQLSIASTVYSTTVEKPSENSTLQAESFIGVKTSDDPAFYLTPSSLLLAPSIEGTLPQSNSTRSSQDSLDDTKTIGSDIDNIMSVSQYSDAVGEMDTPYDSRSDTRSDNRSMSEYSSATSTSNHIDFSSLRILGDTGIGELTPLTSFFGEGDQADEEALDATLYTVGTGGFSTTDDEGDSISLDSTTDGRTSASHSQANSIRGTRNKPCSCDVRIQELNRENELLKHQLRKYVTAVQLLHKQHNTSPNASDAEMEARLYEAKLGQLAEMHSELLEMNQKLKLDLNTKEATVQKLTAELMALRGDKPSPVSLWLPCVFLGGPPSDPHHIYQVHIRVGTEEWNVYRRYSDFYTFHKSLSRRYPSTVKSLPSSVKFPPKNLIFNKGNKSALFVEERRQKLELYLRAIVTALVDMEGSRKSSSDSKLNKYSVVTLIPFLNDFYKSANVARHSPSGGISSIKRLSTSCLKSNHTAPPTLGEEALLSSQGKTSPQYTGL